MQFNNTDKWSTWLLIVFRCALHDAILIDWLISSMESDKEHNHTNIEIVTKLLQTYWKHVGMAL